jgi:hypothetical protein
MTSIVQHVNYGHENDLGRRAVRALSKEEGWRKARFEVDVWMGREMWYKRQ